MWPMCSEPVTLGGGITIQNASPGADGSARNKSPFAQKSAHLLSMSCGSYALAISLAILERTPRPMHSRQMLQNFKNQTFMIRGENRMRQRARKATDGFDS